MHITGHMRSRHARSGNSDSLVKCISTGLIDPAGSNGGPRSEDVDELAVVAEGRHFVVDVDGPDRDARRLGSRRGVLRIGLDSRQQRSKDE